MSAGVILNNASENLKKIWLLEWQENFRNNSVAILDLIQTDSSFKEGRFFLWVKTAL
jgi:hypothetical protein